MAVLVQFFAWYFTPRLYSSMYPAKSALLFFSLNPNCSNLHDGLPSLYCLLLFGKVRGHEGSVTKKGQGLESYAWLEERGQWSTLDSPRFI